MEIAENGTTVDELPGFCELLQKIHQRLCRQCIPDATVNETQGQEFYVEQRSRRVQRIKKELCEAPVLGMSTEKGMYVLDTDASVVAISGILHQEQEWNGKTVFRPKVYGSKVLSDTEIKYGAPKAEMFAVVTFCREV